MTNTFALVALLCLGVGGSDKPEMQPDSNRKTPNVATPQGEFHRTKPLSHKRLLELVHNKPLLDWAPAPELDPVERQKKKLADFKSLRQHLLDEIRKRDRHDPALIPVEDLPLPIAYFEGPRFTHRLVKSKPNLMSEIRYRVEATEATRLRYAIGYTMMYVINGKCHGGAGGGIPMALSNPRQVKDAGFGFSLCDVAIGDHVKVYFSLWALPAHGDLKPIILDVSVRELDIF